MNIDTLLNEARDDRQLTAGALVELERLIDGVQVSTRHRRPRRSVIVALVAAGTLLVGGGVTAAAAAVAGHPKWYDAASDWTEKVKAVKRTFDVAGVSHTCTTTFTVESTHNGTSIPEFQEAVRYLRVLNPLKVQPDPAEIASYTSATAWNPPPSPERANDMAWTDAVSKLVFKDLASKGLNSDHIRMSLDSKCDFDTK